VTRQLAQHVFLIVLDQMKYEYIKILEHKKPNLNILQLKRKSASFSKAFVRHLPTSTPPGHATISTGTVPRLHGIVSSTWFDTQKMKIVGAVETYDSRYLSFETLAKSAKMMGFHVAVVAGKVDSAILLGGDIADLIIFPFKFQLPDGGIVWKFVDRKDAINKEILNMSDLIKTPPWMRNADLQLLPEEKYSTKLDLKTCEAVSLVLKNEFHNTDNWMLFVSFGSIDYIGHDHGPGHKKVYDSIVSLDEQLGKILETPRLSDALVCVTSDHGCTSIRNAAKVYVKKENERQTFVLAISDTNGTQVQSKAFPEDVGKHIHFVDSDNFGFVGEGIALVYLKEDKKQVIELVKKYFVNEWGMLVQEAYGRWDNRPEEVEALMCERSGDIVLIPQNRVRFLNYKWGVPKGEHGSLGEDDQHIPLLISGPRIKPGVYNHPVQLHDIAPMIKVILGLPCPQDEEERGEAIVRLIT
jgi:arylsulfatase A-like enzyme